MNRRTFARAVVLIVVLSMLVTGCTPKAAPAQPAGGPEKVVDIEVWTDLQADESAPPPADWVAYDVMRDKLSINMKLVPLPSDQEGVAKLNAAAAANALPDVIRVSQPEQSRNRDMMYQWHQQELIAPVDTLLPLMPVRTKQRYSDPQMNKLATFEGVLYGLVEPPSLPMRLGLIVRKDWLDKLGLEIPTTLDQVFEVAKAFTEQDPDGNGKDDTYGVGAFIDGHGLGTRFDWVFGAYGTAGMWNLSDAAGFGLNVRSPDYMKGVAFIKKLVDARVIDPDWPTLKRDEFRARWKQGKYGLMWEDFCALTCVSNYAAFDQNSPDGEWAVVPAPKGPEGESAYGASVRSAAIIVVSKKAMDAGKGPAIARLLEWMSSEEGYYLLGFGQEGVNYKLDEDGNVTIEGIDPKLAWTSSEQQPLTQLRGWVYYNAPVELKARYGAYETQAGRVMDPLAYLDAFQGEPWVDATGAGLITAPANSADLYRYYDEYLAGAAMGQKPLDEQAWADFIRGLDSLGAKEWEAAAKEALTASGFLQ